MRLGAFFGRPAPQSTPPTTPDDVSLGTPSRRGTPSRSRRSSIASIDMEEPLIESKASRPTNPEYKSWILPFFVNEHVELAPFNRFHSKTDPLHEDQLPLNQDVPLEKVDTRFHKRRRTRTTRPVKEILERMNGTEDAPIDLTESTDELARVPYKYFFFHQDVRPAYQGTYTRVVSPCTARKIARAPAHRGLPDTNYDYDSESEWQEPEEGDEDLMDDDEKSEEDDEEEMEDFLDDEGEVVKRQMIVGDMEPKSSGLCWAGDETQPQDRSDLSNYRMDVLHDSTTFPIDPYSTTHWSDIGKTSPNKPSKAQVSASASAMQPPRLPLMAMDANSGNLLPVPGSNVFGFVASSDQIENKSPNPKLKHGTQAKPGKPVKMIPADLLPAFKEAVTGSTLTKIGLIEVLKSQFPKCSKDAIKDTLSSIAIRQGGKEAEKKWVLNG